VIGQEIAQYRILAKLGAGGMGVVYLAEDARLARRVALKILPAEFARDEDRIVRFERETRAVAALNHPGIAVLYEIGEHQGTHYLAMEFVVGRPLREQLALGPLSREPLTHYTIQIADALEHAHGRGILHRDIKPANILVRSDGLVKLLDFGLAKLLQGGEETRSVVTTPGTWMARCTTARPKYCVGTKRIAAVTCTASASCCTRWPAGACLLKASTARPSSAPSWVASRDRF
jgi:serine/threonine protein kinase